MSIDLEIILGHNLDSDRIANLPTLLDRYFAPHLKNIQLRLEHGYVWSPVKIPSGGWQWEENCSDEQIISHLNEIQPPVKSIKDLIIMGKNDEIESFKYDSYYVENL